MSVGVADMIKNKFDFKCPICLEDYNLRSKYPSVLCLNGHTLCRQCFENHLRYNAYPKCPQCRQPIRYSSFFPLPFTKPIIELMEEAGIKQEQISKKNMVTELQLVLMRQNNWKLHNQKNEMNQQCIALRQEVIKNYHQINELQQQINQSYIQSQKQAQKFTQNRNFMIYQQQYYDSISLQNQKMKIIIFFMFIFIMILLFANPYQDNHSNIPQIIQKNGQTQSVIQQKDQMQSIIQKIENIHKKVDILFLQKIGKSFNLSSLILKKVINPNKVKENKQKQILLKENIQKQILAKQNKKQSKILVKDQRQNKNQETECQGKQKEKKLTNSLNKKAPTIKNLVKDEEILKNISGLQKKPQNEHIVQHLMKYIEQSIRVYEVKPFDFESQFELNHKESQIL